MRFLMPLVFLLAVLSCKKEPVEDNLPYEIYSGSIDLGSKSARYSAFYYKEPADTSHFVFISGGGDGFVLDQLLLWDYAKFFAANGYVAILINHEFVPNAYLFYQNITSSRITEVNNLLARVKTNSLKLGNFKGKLNLTSVGFLGHSAGAVQGLMTAGLKTEFGTNYFREVKAVYAISPPGTQPDYYGMLEDAYSYVRDAAVFLTVGQHEKNYTPANIYTTDHWRFQGFDQMDESGPRYRAYVAGNKTRTFDMGYGNAGIVAYNMENALALFDTYVKGLPRAAEIGALALPAENPVEVIHKGF